MPCLKRGEDFARRAVAADPALADGNIWLAVALGYETRIDGLVMGRLHDAPEQSKAALDAALKCEPQNPYGVAALGGWNIEVVRGGGATLARVFYGATEAQALALFDQAAHLAPGNVAVRYQIALSLAGFDPEKYRARIDSELTAALRDGPATAYEKSDAKPRRRSSGAAAAWRWRRAGGQSAQISGISLTACADFCGRKASFAVKKMHASGRRPPAPCVSSLLKQPTTPPWR